MRSTLKGADGVQSPNTKSSRARSDSESREWLPVVARAVLAPSTHSGSDVAYVPKPKARCRPGWTLSGRLPDGRSLAVAKVDDTAAPSSPMLSFGKRIKTIRAATQESCVCVSQATQELVTPHS
jgi:hypothetical protein